MTPPKPRRLFRGVRANDIQFERIVSKAKRKGRSKAQARAEAVAVVLQAVEERDRPERRKVDLEGMIGP